MIFNHPEAKNFEQLVFCQDEKSGLKAIIGVHSTVLGPAVGGCRMWDYASEAEALNDVLRLSRGMTYKASISGLNWGGGKAVIIGNPHSAAVKTPALLRRFGEYVDRLAGNYVSAKDVGIDSDNLRIIKERTPHVLGIEGEKGSSGDPSPATAFGVYQGMVACAEKALGSASLKGVKVALQGLGSVAFYLLDYLAEEGAVIVACDVNADAIARATAKHRVEIVQPDRIYDVACDIFSPSALGASINPDTLPRIKAKIIAGAANNQLSTEDMGEAVRKRGMVYAPDYAINAGGLINIYHESAVPGGYSKTRAYDHVAKIRGTMKTILDRSEAEKLPTSVVADRIAEERIETARKKLTG